MHLYIYVSDDFILDLPLIECLESTLTRCLEKIFDEYKFSEDYRKVVQIMLKYVSNLCIPLHEDIY